jgi:hypothetical protein
MFRFPKKEILKFGSIIFKNSEIPVIFFFRILNTAGPGPKNWARRSLALTGLQHRNIWNSKKTLSILLHSISITTIVTTITFINYRSIHKEKVNLDDVCLFHGRDFDLDLFDHDDHVDLNVSFYFPVPVNVILILIDFLIV